MKRILYLVLAIGCFGHAAMTSYYARNIWDGRSAGILWLLVFLWFGWPTAIWRAGASKSWPIFILPGLVAFAPTFYVLFSQLLFSSMH
jgi:hypothetical protein